MSPTFGTTERLFLQATFTLKLAPSLSVINLLPVPTLAWHAQTAI